MKPLHAFLTGLIIGTLLTLPMSAFSATNTAPGTFKKKSTASTTPKPSLGTDFKFDDLTVHGQYQSANEGLVTVENHKNLNNLLDYRTDYKDRLNASRLNP